MSQVREGDPSEEQLEATAAYFRRLATAGAMGLTEAESLAKVHNFMDCLQEAYMHATPPDVRGLRILELIRERTPARDPSVAVLGLRRTGNAPGGLGDPLTQTGAPSA